MGRAPIDSIPLEISLSDASERRVEGA
jgi:hypothetical protein